jgi:hydroxymethylpyrimidine pyrophosphatase-like HAD family hydrolase
MSIKRTPSSTRNIALVTDSYHLSMGNLRINIDDQVYVISMNGYEIRYISKLHDRVVAFSKQKLTVWYNIHMYPSEKYIGSEALADLQEGRNAAKIKFIGIDADELQKERDRILVEYVLKIVGDQLG